MAARRCVSCTYDHPPDLASFRCPWCGHRTVHMPSALPTDDGLSRYSPQIVAWRADLARIAERAEVRGITLVDMIDVRDRTVPPPLEHET